MLNRVIKYLIVALILICCNPSKEESSHESRKTNVISLLGKPLVSQNLSKDTQQDFEEKLAKAQKDFEDNPDSLDLIIWYGRRLAYLGRYDEAIAIYSRGLAKHPSSFRLRRHRGHRYITTRQLDLAVADFRKAAELSADAPNTIEPDGLPNTLNIPLSNDKFNIWYHYGLSFYLKGQYEEAMDAYQKCMTYSDNDDLLVATSYWLYMTANRLGRDQLALQTLNNISEDMELIENDAYHDLLLLFKGSKSVKEVLDKATGVNGKLNPTLAYGIGFHHLSNGQNEKALELFNKTLESPGWTAFGYLACEATVLRQ